MKKPALVFTLLLFAVPAYANTIYTYTGNAFNHFVDEPKIPGQYTDQNHVSITLELARPINPNSFFSIVVVDPLQPVIHYAISDGRNSIADEQPPSSPQFFGPFRTFTLVTDGNGGIAFWWFDAEWNQINGINGKFTTFRVVSMNYAPNTFVGVIQSDFGYIEVADPVPHGQTDSGSIGDSPASWAITEVPEIGSLALLLVGLPLLVICRLTVR